MSDKGIDQHYGFEHHWSPGAGDRACVALLARRGLHDTAPRLTLRERVQDYRLRRLLRTLPVRADSTPTHDESSESSRSGRKEG